MFLAVVKNMKRICFRRDSNEEIRCEDDERVNGKWEDRRIDVNSGQAYEATLKPIAAFKGGKSPIKVRFGLGGCGDSSPSEKGETLVFVREISGEVYVDYFIPSEREDYQAAISKVRQLAH